jgi:glutaminyl-tRNA synthetase
MSEASSTTSSTDPGVNEATAATAEIAPNFLLELVASDVAQGKHAGRVATRFPPEPNGYLHIGHAKTICLNFGLAKTFGGVCNLRFDDTNPEAEETEYVEAIKADVRWLGFEWGTTELYASDYFEQLHAFAVQMIRAGTAYVDSQTAEAMKEHRGDFHQKGKDSPFRNRTVEENLDLFARMREGEFADGTHVLRAKGDMASPDMKMRDPLMYRIRHVHHHRTGSAWCIYPMYDWAHGQSDHIEGITHSICTLEFVNHRPLYHWFLTQIGATESERPQQIEFAKLALSYTVLSKRRLLELVRGKHVNGWDDPRMPTIAGMRRRGFSAAAIRKFCERIGVSTRDSVVDIALLEHALREDLNAHSPRVMAVLKPLRVTIRNLPEGEGFEFAAPYNPEAPDGETRVIPFSRDLYIEQDDFAENPPKKYFRLAPGQEVRLRYACVIKCVEVRKNAEGEVTEVVCDWDPTSKGGTPADGRKVKGTIHWVSAKHAIAAEVRLYDRLFTAEDPLTDKDHLLLHFNPNSREIVQGAQLEPSLANAAPGHRVQFERLGYYCVDPDSKPGAPVWNRTITLKDSFAKSQG